MPTAQSTPPQTGPSIARDLDLLLATEKINYGMAARFVLPAAGILPERTTQAEAFASAQERGWLSVQSDEPATLKGISLLIMQAFDVKGGIMYSIFHSQRYAYREMVYKQLIQGTTDPDMPVPGEFLIRMLGNVVTYTGGAQ
ncbi:hypothetical protein FACS1894164_14920 [Spirochaetia bacterium]|nr:hypothetical protein FACS1894164_14920 [Spirochaetia bacterium]